MSETRAQAGGQRLRWALLVFSLVYGALLIRHVWQVGPDGLSAATGTVPFWDFGNLWGGGRIALSGHLADLGEAARYRQDLGTLFEAPIRSGEWSYPPTMLVVGWALAHLPVGPAYLLWTGGTALLLALTIHALGLPRLQGALAMFCPAMMWNMALGQNGALTAALLVGGLLLVDRRPVGASLLLGSLVLKPQLALAVPVVLLARGRWRALAAAAATAGLWGLASVGLFGVNSWTLFLERTGPLMRSILEAPFPQGYQVRAVTPFVLARALHLPLRGAYAVQLLASLSALVAVWRSRRHPDALPRIVLLGVLATPYAYTYDLVALAGPVMQLDRSAARADRLDPWLWAVWLLPCFALAPIPGTPLPLGPVLLGALAWRVCASSRAAKRAAVA